MLFFWGVMLHLMRSLFLTAWDAAGALSGGEPLPASAGGGSARLLCFYLALVVIAVSSLWGWARYNRSRFGGARDKRRVHPPALTLGDLRDYTGFPSAKLFQMRRAKVLVAHFDEARELAEMDCYVSTGEKERLVAAGLPAPGAVALELSMFPPVPLPSEPADAKFYLDPRDSVRLTIAPADPTGRHVIVDVDAVDMESVGV